MTVAAVDFLFTDSYHVSFIRITFLYDLLINGLHDQFFFISGDFNEFRFILTPSCLENNSSFSVCQSVISTQVQKFDLPFKYQVQRPHKTHIKGNFSFLVHRFFFLISIQRQRVDARSCSYWGEERYFLFDPLGQTKFMLIAHITVYPLEFFLELLDF